MLVFHCITFFPSYNLPVIMHKGEGFILVLRHVNTRAGIHPVSCPILTGGFFVGYDGDEVPGRASDDPPPSGTERIHGDVPLLFHTRS